jgi:hypothetical protein
LLAAGVGGWPGGRFMNPGHRRPQILQDHEGPVSEPGRRCPCGWRAGSAVAAGAVTPGGSRAEPPELGPWPSGESRPAPPPAVELGDFVGAAEAALRVGLPG